MRKQDIVLMFVFGFAIFINAVFHVVTWSKIKCSQPTEIVVRDTVRFEDSRKIAKLRKEIREQAEYIKQIESNYEKCRDMLYER